MDAEMTVHPAATVVLLRDSLDGIEVLLLRRNSKLAFHGGAWVFPGGRIDPDDYPGSNSPVELAARTAAIREAHEEAGLKIDPDSLVPLSRWLTPPIRPKRFDTYFFAASAGESHDVEVDGGEILDHRWFSPEAALRARHEGEIELPPPTFVTLTQLGGFVRSADALEFIRSSEPYYYRPNFRKIDEGACSLYSGDAGYENGDIASTGPRHRLWMLESGWRYERSGL